MSKYAVTTGIQTAPVKTVLYGPEGIGKSTFASHFPNPVFIDTEGGTKRLNVKRLPQPTSWAMLLDEVAEVRKGSVPCGTLVIDTAAGRGAAGRAQRGGAGPCRYYQI